MKNLEHIQFQSLSSCEAQAMQRRITDTILEAYNTGMNVILGSYSEPIGDLIEANHKAIRSLGFDGDLEFTASRLIITLQKQVKKEGDAK